MENIVCPKNGVNNFNTLTLSRTKKELIFSASYQFSPRYDWLIYFLMDFDNQ